MLSRNEINSNHIRNVGSAVVDGVTPAQIYLFLVEHRRQSAIHLMKPFLISRQMSSHDKAVGFVQTPRVRTRLKSPSGQ